MNYLILGNSAAAVNAADAIRSVDLDGAITMVSPEEELAYGTPLISYVLEGKTDEEHAGIRSEDWYEQLRVNCIFGAGKAATSIDAQNKEVFLEDGTQLAYDKLLVATGSKPISPEVDGLNIDAPNSFVFNTMSDTRNIMRYLDKELSSKREAHQPIYVVVSGSGLIGAKAAEGICKYVDTTYLVGHAQRPLRKLLDEDAAELLIDVLEERHIVNVSETVVESVETDADGKITTAHLSNGESVPCNILITAIGVQPNVEILETAGAKVERGAVCDKHMMTSLQDIYAAGDVANTHNTLLGDEAPLALWPTASEQGHVAGSAMAGCDDAEYDGSFARNAVGFFGEINILSCGVIDPARNLPNMETKLIRKDKSYCKFNIYEGKLVGYLLVNRPCGAGIYTDIIREKISLQDLPGDIFERVPQLLDLPKAYREAKMLNGYV